MNEFHGMPPDRRVAVLDDDAALAIAISEVLTALGLPADAFRTEAELRLALDRRRYDAFVLDWSLDDGNAAAVIQYLRNGVYTAAPIFLYTGQLAAAERLLEENIARMVDEHRVIYKRKPVRFQALAREIVQALAGTPQRN